MSIPCCIPIFDLCNEEMKGYRWMREHRRTNKNSANVAIIINTHSHAHARWDGFMDEDCYIWEDKSFFFSLAISVFVTCHCGWANSMAAYSPMSGVYPYDLIHLPCITVLLIITLFFFNTSTYPISLDCLVVSSFFFFSLVLFLFCSQV